MTPEEILARQRQLREEHGQRLAEWPAKEAEARKSLYGKETILPAVQQTRDQAISQLWETDKMLADRYANPESEMFIRDPYAREKLVAGRHQSVFENVASLTTAAEGRRNILEDALERGVKIFQLGLEAQEKEYGMLGTEFNEMLNLIQVAQAQTEKGKTKKKETDLAEIMKYVLADVDISNPQELTETLQAIGAKQPELIPDVIKFLGTLPETQADTFGYSQGEVAAGVAGYPKTPENLQIYQDYIRQNRGTGTSITLPSGEEINLGGGGGTPTGGRTYLPTPTPAPAPVQQPQEEGNWLSNILKQIFGGGEQMVSPLPEGTPVPTPVPTPQPSAQKIPTPEEIGQAQDAIEKSTDRQTTYNAIIKDFSYLIGYIQP